jgi:diguanylate cyclase (GGDEF)-like protein
VCGDAPAFLTITRHWKIRVKNIPMIGKFAVLLAIFGCFALSAALYAALQMQHIGAGYVAAANGPATYTLYAARSSGTFGAVRAAIMTQTLATTPAQMKAADAGLDAIRKRFVKFTGEAEAAYPPQADNMQALTAQALNFIDQSCATTISLAHAAIATGAKPADQHAAQAAYLTQCAPAYPKVSQAFITTATAATNSTDAIESHLAALTQHTIKVTFAIIMLGLGAVLAGAILLLRTWVTIPLQALAKVMARLARGELDTDIGGVERRDEIGEMARAVEVFKNAATAKMRLEEEIAMAEEVAKANRASRAELAEKNRALLVETYTDSLTSLANRRCFDDTLRETVQKAAETGSAVGLVLLDIDHFKAYNDSYGHMKGDECLRQVAAAISREVRGADLTARYGGEEFAVVMPDTNAETVQMVAGRMRACIEALALPHEGVGGGAIVTISLGATILVPSDLSDIPVLLETADIFLYTAKRSGRNKLVFGTSTEAKQLALPHVKA